MFFAENLKKSVYVVARSVNNDGVSVFAAPKEYRINVLPTSASADFIEIGASYLDYRQMIGDPVYLKDIKYLDKVYVDQVPPEIPDPLAENADYYVRSILPTPQAHKVILKRLNLEPAYDV